MNAPAAPPPGEELPPPLPMDAVLHAISQFVFDLTGVRPALAVVVGMSHQCHCAGNTSVPDSIMMLQEAIRIMRDEPPGRLSRHAYCGADAMTHTSIVATYVAQRDRILRELDVGAFCAMFPSISRDAALPALHKARYELPDMPAALREESRAWLEREGMKRHRGAPWPPAGELPS